MLVTTEKNYLHGRNFTVITETKWIEDRGTIRVTIPMQIHRREVKIYALKQKKLEKLRYIQKRQLLALTTESDYEARCITEHISLILIPEIHRIDSEIRALEIQIERLKARL